MKVKVVAVLMLAAATAWASEQWVCQLQATSPTPQHTGDAGQNPDAGAGASCNFQPGTQLKMQCDTAVYVCTGAPVGRPGSNPRAGTHCTKVAVGDPYPIKLTATEGTVSILPVSGAAVCQFAKDMK